MTQKNLVKVLCLLAVVAAIIYGFIVVSPYMTEAQQQKTRETASSRELKTLRGLRKIQNDRLIRTIEWAKARNLSTVERHRLMSIEARAGDEEFKTTFQSDYKIPLNPKALVER